MHNIPSEIIAQRCCWCENAHSGIALETIPKEHERYWISVPNAVNLSVGEASWLLYEPSEAYYNDYSEESEFAQTRFCLVNVIARLPPNMAHTRYRVQVQSVVSLEEVMNHCVEQEFRPAWAGFLSGFLAGEEYPLRHYGAYSWLSISLQSDCGLDCVLMQHETRLYACLVCEWGFGYDVVVGGKFRLPELKNNSALLTT
ncbi:MAG: hypothetical protein MUF71_09055 [Candidatus Kapabacteria bacterium]|jgi:hypothetical protein|nr:hypothetical protein [Candidatus Kapabacteria bacterium]